MRPLAVLFLSRFGTSASRAFPSFAVAGLRLSHVLSLALFVLMPLAGARPCPAQQTAEFQCDDRANQWDKDITACPSSGRAYASDGKWRDGVVVKLGGFTYKESNGFPQSAISQYWFTQDGKFLRGKNAVIAPLDYPGKGAPLTIRPDGTFQGVLATQTEQIIPPGRYKVLFRVHYPCGPPASAECSSFIRPTRIPDGFHVEKGKDPFELTYDSSWIISEFAWAWLEIASAKERPEPGTSGFKIACQPVGSQCRAGSRFYFETGGPNRLLRGGGCVKFYPEKGGYPTQADLKDENGNPVYGARNYRMSGLGAMPGPGTWDARFECYEGPPVALGRFVLAEDAKPNPGKPPRSNIEVTLSKPVGDQEGDFIRPQKGDIYTGGWFTAELPAEVTYVSSLDSTFPPLAKGASGNYCGLRVWRPGARTVQTLGKDPELWLDGSLYTGRSATSAKIIGVRAKVPEDMAPGMYKIELRCPSGRYGNTNGPLFGRVEREFEVKAGRHPIVLVNSKALPLTGNRHVDTLRRCAPCNGDDYSLTIKGLEAGDEIVAAKWWSGNWLDADPRGSCRLQFPKIAFQCAASGNAMSFTGKVPGDYDRDNKTWHQLEIVLRDKYNHYYTIPGADISADPEPKDWEPGYGRPHGQFNFYRFCPTFNNDAKPVITGIDKEADLGGALAVGAEKFECSLGQGHGVGVLLKADKPWPIEVALDNVATDSDGKLQARIPLGNRLDPQWLKGVTAPVDATVVLRSYTGLEVSAPVVLVPAISIAASPENPAPGSWVTVRWKGFTPNSSAKLYLDGEVLKGNILLDKGDPSISVRLPDGLAGKRTLRLVDAAGNAAETEIGIAGADAGKVCREPCLIIPEKARQGEKIDVRISGFPRNGDVTVSFAGFRIKSVTQSSLVDGTPFVMPPGLKGGRYQFEARDIYGASSRAEIEVSGSRKAPTLTALPVRATDPEVVYRPGADSVHVNGNGWFLKGRFSARLIGVDAGRTGGIDPGRVYRLTGLRDGCLAYFDPQKAYGRPCNTESGEIDHFWSFDNNVADGRYVLELSDGLTEAITGNAFAVRAQQAAKPNPPPKVPPKVEQDKPQTSVEPAVCNPDLPRTWQPGCVEGKPGNTQDGTNQSDAKECDPGLPKYWQKGCIEKKQGGSDGETPKTEAKPCDPNIPRYWQPGCIEKHEAKPTAPRPAVKCNPGVPRYAQPGCVE